MLSRILKGLNIDKSYIKRCIYANFYKHHSVNKNIVLYMSYYGRGMICNPYGIFKSLSEYEEYNNLIHVWVIDSFDDNSNLIEEYKNNKNVKFVKEGSVSYLRYLATAGYLISNVSFPIFFAKKREQIYINTWHGIPIKTLGYDLPEGKISMNNVEKNFLMADYLLSADSFTTKIYKESYKLDGIFEGKIIEEGYPRNDALFNTDREYIINRLKSYGVNVDENKKILMYAPTWKGSDYGNPDTSVDSYYNFVEKVNEYIDTEKYQVLIKPHQIVYRYIRHTDKMSDIFIPANIDTNEILSVVDVLVSDYSSIYFDFMITKRPILFYIPDIDEYKDYRGLYFNVDDLPGPYTDSLEQMAKWLSNIEQSVMPFEKNYNEKREQFCNYDDGNAAKRVIDIVFGHNDNKYNIIKCDNSKIKILLHQGKFVTNGISSSLINLLNNLNFDRYDVTVAITATNKQEEDNILNINSNARVFNRSLQHSSTLFEEIRMIIVAIIGRENLLGKLLFTRSFFKREWVRCFGNSRFDYIMDFNGYGWYFCYLFLEQEYGKKMIWLHNDMLAERSKKHNNILLKNIAHLYKYYDGVVGCSKAVMKVNRENLADKKSYDKFTYSKNTINFNRIFDGLNDNGKIKKDNKYYYINAYQDNNKEKHSMDLIECVNSEYVNFVTIGRMSAEKNQLELIKAFSMLLKKNPKCRLYMLGDGELYNDINNKVKEEKIEENVIMTGNMSNPFLLMSECDCFVLPSLHEGQPMVVLEARCLKLPMILSDFSTVEDCLIDNGQYLCKKMAEDILEGMEAYIAGKIKGDYDFSPEKYNSEAVEEFENLLTNN